MRQLVVVTGLLALLLILLPPRWAGIPSPSEAAARAPGGIALAPPVRRLDASVTPTCAVPSGYRLLVVYADSAPPTTLRAALLAQPGIGAVDFFDAAAGTPPATQLQLYHAVVVFSSVNHDYQDPVALGDRLADYQDAGGVVLADYGSFFAFGSGGIRGRWLTQGYAPFTYTVRLDGSPVSLGAYDPTHPLMAGVGTLNATLRPAVSLAPGATLVATYSDGSAALAVQGSPAHPALGLTAYLGEDPGAGTGDYARVIANGVRWLIPTLPCSTATATGTPPTATGTPTASRTPTAPPTAPPTATPVPPTATRTPVVGTPTPVCDPAW